jgi:hypothetical protein
MDKWPARAFHIQELFVLALRLLDSELMIAVLILFGLIAAGLGIGLVATAKAPVGYQDETGFHFGQQNGASEETFVYGLAQPKPA